MIKKILLIDDDVDFTEACKNFLDAANFEVECENNDANAFEKIKQFKPDLVLLDVMMSKETSGFEIADMMSLDDEFRNTPVILLTGYFKRPDIIENGRGMISKWKNVKFILDKPIKPSILLGVVQKVQKG